ncbi:helix-turn-helix transcriptional regulator [Clavibacter zhangzhiyongii]|uniref:helix-turn-helix transcriptional regulator n=1 Tax=Clavibacter zhangzhiyongii TaxID=2768071 RepID=UPI0039E112AA
MASKLLLFPEVAERLRRTDAQLRWMIHSGTIVKPANIGGRLVWREDDLEAWIDSQFEKSA